jgi:ATP/maltotriose-dependent transcriptional regulator MalT
LPELARRRSAREWPVLNTAAALVQGQHALLRADLATERSMLERAIVLQRGGWLPAFMGDARFALAVCRAMQGEPDAAAAALDEVLSECVHEEGLGMLPEPPGRLHALWQTLESRPRCPAAPRAQLRHRLATWQMESRHEGTPADAEPPDEPLSAREREVPVLLADGQSNTLIARALGLGLQTVKRHVAHILTKLALDSRSQAPAYGHRR